MDQINVDVLLKIQAHLNWTDISGLARSSKTHHMIFEQSLQSYESATYSFTRLYPRQSKKIRELLAKCNAPETRRIKFHACMSFGKTLVALEVAVHITAPEIISIKHANRTINTENFAASPNVYILIPGTIKHVWQLEIKKHYPALSRGPVKNRRILFAMPGSSSIAYHDEQKENLRGKIIVVSRNVKTYNEGLIIVDEMHRNTATAMNFIQGGKTCPYITMGASIERTKGTREESHLEISTAEIANEIIVPAYTIEILKMPTNQFTDEKLRRLIDVEIRRGSHTVIIGDRFYEIPSTPGLFIHKSTGVIASRKQFEIEGGVYLTSVNKIAEGHNLNYCDRLIMYIGSGYTLARLQQCIGRVIRQSAKYPMISITVMSPCNETILRSLLLGIACDGYDTDCRLGYLVDFYGVDFLKKLTPIERLLLFSRPAGQTNYYDSQASNYSPYELLAIRSTLFPRSTSN